MDRQIMIVAGCAALLMGCAAPRLVVTDQRLPVGEVADVGFPFHAPAAYVFEGKLTKRKDGKECDQTTGFYEVKTLPVGKEYFVRFVPGTSVWNQKFSIEYADGALKNVTLNADSNVPQAVQSVTDLLAKVGLPLLGVTGAGGKGGPPRQQAAELPCDTGQNIEKVTPLSEWLKAHGG